MTDLQKAMIIKIARSEYSVVNGAIPESIDDVGQIWADCIIEDAEDKGVFTSLLKEKLVFHTGPHDPDAGCGLTDKGFQEYLKLK